MDDAMNGGKNRSDYMPSEHAMGIDFQSKGSIGPLVSICESLKCDILADPSCKNRVKREVWDNIKKSFLQWLRSKDDEKGLILFEKRPKEIKRYICDLLVKKKIQKCSSRARKLKNGYLGSSGYEIMVHMISNRAWDGSDSKKIYLISKSKRAFNLAVFTFVFKQLPDHVQMWWEKKTDVSFLNNNHRYNYYNIFFVTTLATVHTDIK